jgi:hypothetical protein
MRLPLLAAFLLGVVACEKPAPAPPQKRATLNRTGGTTFELIPTAGQQEHCLAYTVSRSGLTRQLTMSRSNLAFECAPGRPIGGHPFKVPLNEGPVKIFIFFSSEHLNAGSVSQQLLDAPDRQALSVMNMRLPGKAALEVLEFTPEEDVAPEVGELVQPDGGQP